MNKNIFGLAIALFLVLVAVSALGEVTPGISAARKPTKIATRTPKPKGTRRVTKTLPHTAGPSATASETLEGSATPSETHTLTLLPPETPSDTPDSAAVTATETNTATETVPAETATPSGTVAQDETLTPTDTDTPDPATPTGTAEATVTETLALPTETETPTATALPASETPTETIPAKPTQESAAELSPKSPGATNSSVILYNPGSKRATARLHVFAADAREVFNAIKKIEGHGVTVVALPGNLGSPFRGSALVASQEAIRAMVLNANKSGNARELYEGGGGANADLSLTIPVFRHLGSAATKSVITVQNTELADAQVTLHYFNADGTEGTGSPLAPVRIAPMAAATFDSQTLFGSDSFTYTVRLDSTTNIAAAESVRYALDTAAVRGLSRADASKGTIVLNQIARSSKGVVPLNWSELYIHNTGSAAANAVVKFFAKNGHEVNAASRTATIPPDGFATVDTRALGALGTFVGYATVTQNGTNVPLAAGWLAIAKQGKQFSALDGVPTASAATTLVCGDVRRIPTPAKASEFTVLKITNTDTANSKLVVKFYTSDGSVALTKNYTLGANRQLAITLKKMNALPAGYRGIAIVQSGNDQTMVVTASTGFGKRGGTSYTCTGLSRR